MEIWETLEVGKTYKLKLGDGTILTATIIAASKGRVAIDDLFHRRRILADHEIVGGKEILENEEITCPKRSEKKK